VNARLTIPGRLPGLNELISNDRGNKFAAAKEKKTLTAWVAALARKQCPFIFIRTVEITFAWYEKDERRDIDNVAAAGTKVILDGLVEASVLHDDGRKYVRAIHHLFPAPDKTNPRIEVHIVEDVPG
jgi:Holliday junction resolvase RusA-like endonuclease